MKVILVKPPKTVVAFSIFIATLVFLVPLLVIYPHSPGDRSLFSGVMALIFLIDATAVYTLISFLRQGQRAEALLSAADISEDGVSFIDEIEFEYGIFNTEGWWSSSGNSRSYRVSREFIRAGKARASYLPFINAEFRMAVRRDGTGFVSAPAVRILEGPYRDVVLLFITDRGKVNAGGNLILSADSDSAQVTVKGIGKEVTGSRILQPQQGAEGEGITAGTREDV